MNKPIERFNAIAGEDFLCGDTCMVMNNTAMRYSLKLKTPEHRVGVCFGGGKKGERITLTSRMILPF